MSKSEAGFITHSRTGCDLGKKGGSCTWYMCVLFHRWEEWWMDEVYSHCNGTPVYHGGWERGRGVLEKIKFSLFNQRCLNEFLTIYPCCAFMISLQDWGGGYENWEWKGVEGHHMKSQEGLFLFYKGVKEPTSVYLATVGFSVLKSQSPLNIRTVAIIISFDVGGLCLCVRSGHL